MSKVSGAGAAADGKLCSVLEQAPAAPRAGAGPLRVALIGAGQIPIAAWLALSGAQIKVYDSAERANIGGLVSDYLEQKKELLKEIQVTDKQMKFVARRVVGAELKEAVSDAELVIDVVSTENLDVK